MRSRRVAFGYIAQLDLPGDPIKIGMTSRPRCRFNQFNLATPVPARMIGLTLNGLEREREMLAVTERRKIKGEWRYVTEALGKLVAGYHAAGEWFVPAPDHKAHFLATEVEARVLRTGLWDRRVSHTSHEYHWARAVLKAAMESDPMLGLDWAGYVRAPEPPSLVWPRLRSIAA